LYFRQAQPGRLFRPFLRICYIIQSSDFDPLYSRAREHIPGPRTGPAEDAARVEQWRRQEWHAYFRWKLCGGKRDYSKLIWIALLIAGFAGLIAYGMFTQRWFVTAGGIVVWFTLVNLAFLTYFGPQVPPPRAVPGPFEATQLVRAKIGIYPAGYEWRKLPRVWVRMASPDGPPHVLALVFDELPRDLYELMKKQETWRIQRADAPLTDAVVETLAVSREGIDSGAHPVKIVAWRWNEQALEPFDRKAQ